MYFLSNNLKPAAAIAAIYKERRLERSQIATGLEPVQFGCVIAHKSFGLQESMGLD